MGVGGNGADDLHTVEAVDVGGVDECQVNSAGGNLLADVTDGLLLVDLALELGALVAGGAFLGNASGVGAGLTVGVVEGAHGGESLVGVVACGDGGVTDGNGVLAGSGVLQGDLGDLGILSGNDDEVVGEHLEAGVGVDQAGGLGVIHLGVGGADQDVSVCAALELLVKLAGGEVLGVFESDVGVVLGVEGLNVLHGLGQRVCSENLQLDVLLGLGTAAGEREGQGGAAGSCENRNDLLLHQKSFLCKIDLFSVSIFFENNA